MSVRPLWRKGVLCAALGVCFCFCSTMLASAQPQVSTESSSLMTAPAGLAQQTQSSLTQQPCSDKALQTKAGVISAQPAEQQWLWPLPYTTQITQYFNYGVHSGIDIAATGVEGQPVLAAKSGTVVRVWDGCANSDGMQNQGQGCSELTGCALHQLSDVYQINGTQRRFCNNAQGNALTLRHGQQSYTSYYHLLRLTVQQGDFVQQGQVIGYVGSTGLSSDAHLHFCLQCSPYVIPTSFLDPDPAVQSYIYYLRSDMPTVQFATPQGTCSESLRLYSAGSVLGVLPRASCSGKRFVGWCYADGSPALPTDTLTDLDCILYAVFQRSIPIYATRAGIDCPR